MSKFVESRAEAEQLLRNKGIQPSAQRVEVLYQLHACACHRTADELHELLNREFTKVSRATVYNTLDVLKEHGLVNEVVAEPGRIHYDPNVSAHHHFYNVDTGELIDIPAELVGSPAVPSVPAGTTLQGVDIIIRVHNAK